jgi:hypothetical protein
MQHASNGTGPSCPKPQRLRELQDWVGELEGALTNSTDNKELTNFRDCVDALEWLATMLENRALYHKKQQLKKKVVFALAREHGLLDEANALTRESLHEFVSNQPPDKDEIELDLGGDNE